MGMSFADIVASLHLKNAPAVAVQSGEVTAATLEQMKSILPSLYGDTVAPSWDGKSKFFATPSGHICTVRRESDGSLIVNQPGVVVTPGMAVRILQDFANHNRRPTDSAVKRYAKDQSEGNWDYVGNTAVFVVGQAHGVRFIGQANGGHSMRACVKSGVAITMDFVFGIPESRANRLDVNIARTGKDTIGRKHRYDQYAGQTQIDGEPLGRSLKAADIAKLDNIHSQALRLVACSIAHKPAKDSEPLGAVAMDELDDKYGESMQGIVAKVFLLNQALLRTNDKAKVTSGALAYYVSLSHAVAVLTISAVEASASGTLHVNRDVVSEGIKTLANLGNEGNQDGDDSAVNLR